MERWRRLAGSHRLTRIRHRTYGTRRNNRKDFEFPEDRYAGSRSRHSPRLGAAAIVTLLEPKGAKFPSACQTSRRGSFAPKYAVSFLHLPIVDVSVPDKQFEQRWDIAVRNCALCCVAGLDVLVHCRGGLGRAGTIAARLFAELGMEPEKRSRVCARCARARSRTAIKRILS